MFNISDTRIDQLMAEDVPYFDLTTTLCGIEGQAGKLEYYTRENCILAGTQFVKKMAAHTDATVIDCAHDGDAIEAGATFMTVEGPAEALLMLWKAGLNVFDRCSAVATRTRAIVDAAHAGNPDCEIVTTRKSMPGAKDLLTCAILAGGAYPHRLGLSETVLIFSEHYNFMGGFEGLVQTLPDIRANSVEKRVFVEASAEQARVLARGIEGKALVDGIQLDKMPVEEMTDLVREIRAIDPHIVLIAAGGINQSNAEAYAATGVNGIATTAPFNAAALDMSARIFPLE